MVWGAAWGDLRYRPVSLSGSTWSLVLLWIHLEALFCFMTVDECFQKHSLHNWVGMPWFLRSRKFFDLLEEYGSSWDDFGSSVSIPVIASYIWDVGEAYLITSCEYVRYSGIVRTMPAYLLWPLGIWSGSLFCNLCSCDYWLTFGTAVSELLWRYDCWRLDTSWEVKQIFWVCEILRHCEDNAYVSYSASRYLIWRAASWSLCLWLVANV